MRIKLPEATVGHVFFLLALFWIAWLYTEVTEYAERSQFIAETQQNLAELNDFAHKGDRFTVEDGIRLESRIEKLEQAQQNSENSRNLEGY